MLLSNSVNERLHTFMYGFVTFLSKVSRAPLGGLFSYFLIDHFPYAFSNLFYDHGHLLPSPSSAERTLIFS